MKAVFTSDYIVQDEYRNSKDRRTEYKKGQVVELSEQAYQHYYRKGVIAIKEPDKESDIAPVAAGIMQSAPVKVELQAKTGKV